MANLYLRYSGLEEEEYQSLPYENIDTSHPFGIENLDAYYPVSYSECCCAFSAICDADDGPDNRPLAQAIPQDLWNTGFGE
jgi:hypothetical protein